MNETISKMETFFLYSYVVIQVPDTELRHVGKGQTTVHVRGRKPIYVIQNADGTYAGWITINNAERCKEGLCNPRIQ
jgi:hypothetical protein